MFKIEKEIINNKEQYYISIEHNKDFDLIDNKDINTIFKNNNTYDYSKFENKDNIEKLRNIFSKEIFDNVSFLNFHKIFNEIVINPGINLTLTNTFIKFIKDTIDEYLKQYILKILLKTDLNIKDIVCTELRLFKSPNFNPPIQLVDVDSNDNLYNYTILFNYKIFVDKKFNDLLRYQFNEDELRGNIIKSNNLDIPLIKSWEFLANKFYLTNCNVYFDFIQQYIMNTIFYKVKEIQKQYSFIDFMYNNYNKKFLKNKIS